MREKTSFIAPMIKVKQLTNICSKNVKNNSKNALFSSKKLKSITKIELSKSGRARHFFSGNFF